MKFIVTKGEFALLAKVLLCEILQVTFYHNVLFHTSPKQALYKHCYQNISDANIFDCITHCVNNCSCLSFQKCGSTCQLCNSSKLQNPEDMHENEDCINYIFSGQQVKVHCGDDGGAPVTNCCFTSQPCLNGGTCQPVLPTTSHKRFSCACPGGYQGDRCEATCPSGYGGKGCQPIQSCRSYVNSSRIPGNYTIIDNQNKPLKVFCDFDTTTAMTWTLVQSYELSQNTQFYDKPLSEDHPINNRIPSWKKYRLSCDQMTSIQQDSTKWRLTRRYDREGVNYIDYMSGLNNKLDILNFEGHQCVDVEYINIRDESCTNCNVWLSQSRIFILHIYYDKPCHSPCSVKPSFGSSSKICKTKADYFGTYDVTDPDHRCSSDGQATTQTWFGGY